MEKSVRKQYIIVVVLIMTTGGLLLFQRDATVSDKVGVVPALPVRVGDYIAGERFYCQNEQCGEVFSESDDKKGLVCKMCGNDLDYMSPGEKRLFPGDTVVLRKEYTSPTGRKMMVSVVVSGKEQKSIHRPQQCLPAHGYVIDQSKSMKVSLHSGDSLDVMALDSIRNWQSLDGRKGRHLACYAYWFVGAGRETQYHLKRLFWMSVDKAFKNKSSRWSYVSVMAERKEGSTKHEEEISDFIADIYPLIILPGKGQ